MFATKLHYYTLLTQLKLKRLVRFPQNNYFYVITTCRVLDIAKKRATLSEASAHTSVCSNVAGKTDENAVARAIFL